MSAVTIDALLLRVEFPKAVFAVACPLCKVQAGEQCRSTGGGNSAVVKTHEKRWACLSGWTTAMLAEAQRLVVAQGRQASWHMPTGYYAQTQAWAAEVAATKASMSPTGVRLSEAQAEEIERAAHCDGVVYVSTAHFHGDAQHRQSTNALERKGILRDTGVTTDGGWDRRLELTSFGWQVYRRHRLVIRRLSDEVAAEFESRARDAEVLRAREAQVAAVADVVADAPGAVAPRVEFRLPARPLAPVVPLAPFRGGDLVSLDAAREKRARRGVPSLPGGAA